MNVTLIGLCRPSLVYSALMAMFLLGPTSGIVKAGPPRATIDVGTTVECQDVTPPEFVAAHPQEKIIEAKFRLSVLLQEGREQDLEQLQLAIDSPQRRLRVVDFQPRTELASDLAGDVEVCNTDDTVQSLNASLGGVVAADHGPGHMQVSPAAGVGVTQNRGSKETYHRLPPKQLVLASGTTNAEHGVFFKWRRSSQVALEGSREVTCRFIVPHDWSGDWVQINCEVLGRHKNYFTDKIELAGRAWPLVALYLSGNATAQDAAAALAFAQAPRELAASSSATAHSHTAYKPNVPADRRASQDWFSLPTFKLCSQQRDTSATPDATEIAGKRTAYRLDVPAALEQLRQLSGTRGAAYGP